MNKKEMLDNFFNTSTSSKKNNVSKSASKSKTIKNRKIYDDPNKTFIEEIIELNTSDIYISPYKVDRDNIDTAGIESLGENMKNIGQLQPCTVRYNPNPSGSETYELIFGERRYRAAIFKNLMLKVIVKDIDDQSSALQLLSENRNREDNTDYQLFRQIHKFISENILRQRDIVEKTGISRQKISKLMCFDSIPETIKEKITDYSKISSTTAEAISRITKKESNINPILEIIEKIQCGEYGHTKIQQYVDKYNLNKVANNHKFLSSNGRHLFTIRKDNNNLSSIHFPKDVLNLFETKKINESEFYEIFKKLLEEAINEIK